jgi:hypothetical protein
MTRTFLALFLLSACLSAQTETSLTVTSTLSISLPPPDQALLSITVTTPLNTGLDDVLTALASAGITASNLSTVSSQTNQTNTVILQWTFWLPVPLATLKTSLNALLALQQSLGQQNSAWTLTYYVQQVQSSAATPPCPTAELLSDAQAQAQKLVSASPALSVGPILALSDGTGVTMAIYTYGVQAPVDFLLGTAAFASTPACTLTVKFALQRYQ